MDDVTLLENALVTQSLRKELLTMTEPMSCDSLRLMIAIAKKISPKAGASYKLNQIASLKDNWNGNGAKAFSADLVSKTNKIISSLVLAPELFPTACGTIQLEYDRGDGGHLEIEIGESDKAELYIQKADGAESSELIDCTVFAIQKAVVDFYE